MEIDKCCVVARIIGTNDVVVWEASNPLIHEETEEIKNENNEIRWVYPTKRTMKFTATMENSIRVEKDINIEDITEQDVNRILDSD